MKNNLLVLTGGVIGGVLGHFAFLWLVKQGLYGLILPGGLVGLGAGIVKSKSLLVSILCGILALIAGALTEWRFMPFAADDGLGYFLLHLHQLRPVSLLMLAAGGFLGFWVPFRRRQIAGKAL